MRTVIIVDMPRRWRRAIVAAVVVLVFGAVVFASVVGQRGVAADRVAKASLQALAARQISGATLASLVDPNDPLPARPINSPGNDAEVCGLPAGSASATFGADGQGGRIDTANPLRLPPQTRQVLERLRFSPNELTQAAGWMLAMALADSAAAARSAGEVGDRVCTLFGCRDPAPTADQARDKLAGLAVATRDPRVYALGFKACRHAAADDGQCRQVNAAQWAHLDPDNAAPWLFTLATAEATGDRVAQGEALFRIAAASHNDLYAYDAAAVIVDAAPDDDASLFGTLVVTQAEIRLEASLASIRPEPLDAACSALALADSNRAQTCAAVADLLTDRSTALADRQLGAWLGIRLGWPVDRLIRVQAENSAYFLSLAERKGETDDAGSRSCPALRRHLDNILQRTEVGEIEAAREGLARSGRRVEDFVGPSRDVARPAAEVAGAPPRDATVPVADDGSADAAAPVARTAAER